MDMNNTFIQNVSKLRESVVWCPIKETNYYAYTANVTKDDGGLIKVFNIRVSSESNYWIFDSNSLPITIYLNSEIPITEELRFNDLNIEPIITDNIEEFKSKIIKIILKYFNI